MHESLKKLRKKELSEDELNSELKHILKEKTGSPIPWATVVQALISQAPSHGSQNLFKNVSKIIERKLETTVKKGIEKSKNHVQASASLLRCLLNDVRHAEAETGLPAAEATHLTVLLLSAVIDFEVAGIQSGQEVAAVSKIFTSLTMFLKSSEDNILDTILRCKTLTYPSLRKPGVFVPLIERIFTTLKRKVISSPVMFLKYLVLGKLLLFMTPKEELSITRTSFCKQVQMPAAFMEWAVQNNVLWLSSIKEWNTKCILRSMTISLAIQTLYNEKGHLDSSSAAEISKQKVTQKDGGLDIENIKMEVLELKDSECDEANSKLTTETELRETVCEEDTNDGHRNEVAKISKTKKTKNTESTFTQNENLNSKKKREKPKKENVQDEEVEFEDGKCDEANSENLSETELRDAACEKAGNKNKDSKVSKMKKTKNTESTITQSENLNSKKKEKHKKENMQVEEVELKDGKCDEASSELMIRDENKDSKIGKMKKTKNTESTITQSENLNLKKKKEKHKKDKKQVQEVAVKDGKYDEANSELMPEGELREAVCEKDALVEHKNVESKIRKMKKTKNTESAFTHNENLNSKKEKAKSKKAAQMNQHDLKVKKATNSKEGSENNGYQDQIQNGKAPVVKGFNELASSVNASEPKGNEISFDHCKGSKFIVNVDKYSVALKTSNVSKEINKKRDGECEDQTVTKNKDNSKNKCQIENKNYFDSQFDLSKTSIEGKHDKECSKKRKVPNRVDECSKLMPKKKKKKKVESVDHGNPKPGRNSVNVNPKSVKNSVDGNARPGKISVEIEHNLTPGQMEHPVRVVSQKKEIDASKTDVIRKRRKLEASSPVSSCKKFCSSSANEKSADYSPESPGHKLTSESNTRRDMEQNRTIHKKKKQCLREKEDQRVTIPKEKEVKSHSFTVIELTSQDKDSQVCSVTEKRNKKKESLTGNKVAESNIPTESRESKKKKKKSLNGNEVTESNIPKESNMKRSESLIDNKVTESIVTTEKRKKKKSESLSDTKNILKKEDTLSPKTSTGKAASNRSMFNSKRPIAASAEIDKDSALMKSHGTNSKANTTESVLLSKGKRKKKRRGNDKLNESCEQINEIKKKRSEKGTLNESSEQTKIKKRRSGKDTLNESSEQTKIKKRRSGKDTLNESSEQAKIKKKRREKDTLSESSEQTKIKKKKRAKDTLNESNEQTKIKKKKRAKDTLNESSEQTKIGKKKRAKNTLNESSEQTKIKKKKRTKDTLNESSEPNFEKVNSEPINASDLSLENEGVDNTQENKGVDSTQKTSTPCATAVESDSDLEIIDVMEAAPETTQMNVENYGNGRGSVSEIDEASGSDEDLVPCDEVTKMFTDEETQKYHKKLREEFLQRKVEDILEKEEREYKEKLHENLKAADLMAEDSSHDKTVVKKKCKKGIGEDRKNVNPDGNTYAANLVSNMMNKLYKEDFSERIGNEDDDLTLLDQPEEEDISIILETIVQDTGKLSSIDGLIERHTNQIKKEADCSSSDDDDDEKKKLSNKQKRNLNIVTEKRTTNDQILEERSVRDNHEKLTAESCSVSTEGNCQETSELSVGDDAQRGDKRCIDKEVDRNESDSDIDVLIIEEIPDKNGCDADVKQERQHTESQTSKSCEKLLESSAEFQVNADSEKERKTEVEIDKCTDKSVREYTVVDIANEDENCQEQSSDTSAKVDMSENTTEIQMLKAEEIQKESSSEIQGKPQEKSDEGFNLRLSPEVTDRPDILSNGTEKRETAMELQEEPVKSILSVSGLSNYSSVGDTDNKENRMNDLNRDIGKTDKDSSVIELARVSQEDTEIKTNNTPSSQNMSEPLKADLKCDSIDGDCNVVELEETSKTEHSSVAKGTLHSTSVNTENSNNSEQISGASSLDGSDMITVKENSQLLDVPKLGESASCEGLKVMETSKYMSQSNQENGDQCKTLESEPEIVSSEIIRPLVEEDQTDCRKELLPDLKSATDEQANNIHNEVDDAYKPFDESNQTINGSEAVDEAYEASSDASEVLALDLTPKVRKRTRSQRRSSLPYLSLQQGSDSDLSPLQRTRKSKRQSEGSNSATKSRLSKQRGSNRTSDSNYVDTESSHMTQNLHSVNEGVAGAEDKQMHTQDENKLPGLLSDKQDNGNTKETTTPSVCDATKEQQINLSESHKEVEKDLTEKGVSICLGNGTAGTADDSCRRLLPKDCNNEAIASVDRLHLEAEVQSDKNDGLQSHASGKEESPSKKGRTQKLRKGSEHDLIRTPVKKNIESSEHTIESESLHKSIQEMALAQSEFEAECAFDIFSGVKTADTGEEKEFLDVDVGEELEVLSSSGVEDEVINPQISLSEAQHSQARQKKVRTPRTQITRSLSKKAGTAEYTCVSAALLTKEVLISPEVSDEECELVSPGINDARSETSCLSFGLDATPEDGGTTNVQRVSGKKKSGKIRSPQKAIPEEQDETAPHQNIRTRTKSFSKSKSKSEMMPVYDIVKSGKDEMAESPVKNVSEKTPLKLIEGTRVSGRVTRSHTCSESIETNDSESTDLPQSSFKQSDLASQEKPKISLDFVNSEENHDKSQNDCEKKDVSETDEMGMESKSFKIASSTEESEDEPSRGTNSLSKSVDEVSAISEPQSTSRLDESTKSKQKRMSGTPQKVESIAEFVSDAKESSSSLQVIDDTSDSDLPLLDIPSRLTRSRARKSSRDSIEDNSSIQKTSVATSVMEVVDDGDAEVIKNGSGQEKVTKIVNKPKSNHASATSPSQSKLELVTSPEESLIPRNEDDKASCEKEQPNISSASSGLMSSTIQTRRQRLLSSGSNCKETELLDAGSSNDSPLSDKCLSKVGEEHSFTSPSRDSSFVRCSTLHTSPSSQALAPSKQAKSPVKISKSSSKQVISPSRHTRSATRQAESPSTYTKSPSNLAQPPSRQTKSPEQVKSSFEQGKSPSKEAGSSFTLDQGKDKPFSDAVDVQAVVPMLTVDLNDLSTKLTLKERKGGSTTKSPQKKGISSISSSLKMDASPDSHTRKKEQSSKSPSRKVEDSPIPSSKKAESSPKSPSRKVQSSSKSPSSKVESTAKIHSSKLESTPKVPSRKIASASTPKVASSKVESTHKVPSRNMECSFQSPVRDVELAPNSLSKDLKSILELSPKFQQLEFSTPKSHSRKNGSPGEEPASATRYRTRQSELMDQSSSTPTSSSKILTRRSAVKLKRLAHEECVTPTTKLQYSTRANVRHETASCSATKKDPSRESSSPSSQSGSKDAVPVTTRSLRNRLVS